MSFDLSKFPEETFTLHGSASFRAKPGRGDEFEGLLRKVVGQIHSEPGVLIYEIACDQEDRLKFLIFERYAGRAAFKAHIDTNPFLDIWESGVLDEPSFFIPIESTPN